MLILLQCRRDKHRSTKLFLSKLRLSQGNDHINNFKDYGDFAEENKHYDSSHSQDDDTQPNDVTSWSQLQKKKTRRVFSSSWPHWDTSHQ